MLSRTKAGAGQGCRAASSPCRASASVAGERAGVLAGPRRRGAPWQPPTAPLPCRGTCPGLRNLAKALASYQATHRPRSDTSFPHAPSLSHYY